MEFGWDEAKHERNVRERGFGFDVAARIFEGRTVEWEDTRFAYGEKRMIAVGRAGREGPDRRLHRSRRRPLDHRILAVEPEGTKTMARMTWAEIKARRPVMDRAKLDATTEEDIRRYMIEDGYDPDAEPTGYQIVEPAKTIRKRLGMTQEQFAAALRIPVATLRNWEQGRALPDPAARSLLNIVARNPKAALEALAETV